MNSGRLKILAFSLLCFAAGSCQAGDWVLNDGTKYFGKPVSYDLDSKQVTIVKIDGKEHSFGASELTFISKWDLVWTDAFGKALENYSPPLAPIFAFIAAALLAIAIPTFIGLWGGAHVFGAVSGIGKHVRAFGKVLAVVVVQAVVILLGLIALDSDLPLIPDKNADVLLIMMASVMGLLVAALVLSIHYERPFWKGLGIALVSGVFAGIVGLAMMLIALFLALQNGGVEGVITHLVFEPFRLF